MLFRSFLARSIATSFALGLAVTADAQVQVQVTTSWRQIADNSAAGSPYRLVAGGNLSGNRYSDVAYLAGSTVMLCAAPAIHTFAKAIAPTLNATGIATIPAGGGDRDALAIATAAGLYQWSTSGTVLIDARAWASVVCGDVNADGTPDLVGIDGTSAQVLVLLRSPGGGAGTPTAVQFTGQIVRNVATVQWDSGSRKIAVATNQRLWVGNTSGQQTWSLLRSTSDSLGLVPIRFGPGNAIEGLAWLAKSAAGVTSLLTLRPGLATESLNVDVLSPAAMTVGDWQGDKYDDVVITSTTQTAAAVLTNCRALAQPTVTFDLGAQVNPACPYGSATTSGATASAWIGDCDGDGQCDFVMPRRDLGSVVVMRKCYAYAPVDDTVPNADCAATESGGVVTFFMQVTGSQTPPAGATDVELKVYQTNALPPVIPQLPPEQLIGMITILPTPTIRLLGSTQSGLLTWTQSLSDAQSRFQYAVLRYKSATKVWPPLTMAISYPGPTSPPTTASHHWMDYWGNSSATPVWTWAPPRFSYAAGAGVIKPPPPPPPPPPLPQ